MTRRSVLQALLSRRAAALGCVFLAITGGAALAQTTGAIDQGPAPAQGAAKQEMPPPGGCTPIGLTVAGEIVFPFQCKDFIERQKAMLPKATVAQEEPHVTEDKPASVAEDKPAAAEDTPPAAEQKPAVADQKPAVTSEQPAVVDDKPAAKPAESAPPELSKPSIKPSAALPSSKRAEQKPGAEQKQAQLATPLCKHFRSYNAAAGTYKAFDGRTRPCK
jgi:BA14K-like protein